MTKINLGLFKVDALSQDETITEIKKKSVTDAVSQRQDLKIKKGYQLYMQQRG